MKFLSYLVLKHVICHLPSQTCYQCGRWEVAVVVCAEMSFLTRAWRVSISTCKECHCLLASASSALASLRAAPPRLTCSHAASSWVMGQRWDIGLMGSTSNHPTHGHTPSEQFCLTGTQRRSSHRWTCWPCVLRGLRVNTAEQTVPTHFTAVRPLTPSVLTSLQVQWSGEAVWAQLWQYFESEKQKKITWIM